MGLLTHWAVTPNANNSYFVDFFPRFHKTNYGLLIQRVFASIEHMFLGNAAANYVAHAGLTSWTFSCGQPTKAVSLTYGQIVALAGDYYSRWDDVDHTYTGTRRDNALVKQPLSTAPDIADTLAILGDVKTEEEIKKHVQTLVARHANHNYAWRTVDNDKGVDEWLADPKNTVKLRFGALALENWDHFHPHCLRRYAKLHRRAVLLAANIGRQYLLTTQDPTRAPDALATVLSTPLAMNAFADHFLSDAFSGGHLYGRRKEDYDTFPSVTEISSGSSVIPDPDIDGMEVILTEYDLNVHAGEVAVGQAAKTIHDELGKGVLVESCAYAYLNGSREKFIAVGDDHLTAELAVLHLRTLAPLTSAANQKDMIKDLSPQTVLLFMAMCSSILEVIVSFVRGAGASADLAQQMLEGMLPPLCYVPHRADGEAHCCPPSFPKSLCAALQCAERDGVINPNSLGQHLT